jgi:hypothetical protein
MVTMVRMRGTHLTQERGLFGFDEEEVDDGEGEDAEVDADGEHPGLAAPVPAACGDGCGGLLFEGAVGGGEAEGADACAGGDAGAQ